jgi:multiple antibiotic resistance protein
VTALVLASFTAFLVTVNPVESAALFSALTAADDRPRQRRIALKSTLIAGGLLALFALLGDDLLRVIGISLAGVRVGGGILLMLVSIDLVFGRSLGPPPAAAGGPAGASDISVFPLATPIIAGPGAITAVIVQSSEVNNAVVPTAIILAVLALVMLITLAAMLAVGTIQRWLGETGMSMVTRVLGTLLTALAAELILKGLKDSGVFH